MVGKIIEHEGVVTARKNGILTIEIQVSSACGSCHAKNSCMVSETDQKHISVKDTGKYQIGDSVIVLFEERQGLKAVFLGYLLPFLIVFISLIICVNIFNSEVAAGLTALLFLVPYYLALYIFRDKIKKNFMFQLKEKNL